MNIYYNEKIRLVIATTDKYAYSFYIHAEEDPVESATRMIKIIKETNPDFQGCQFVTDTETDSNDQPPTPRADAVKNELIPKGIPKPEIK